MAHTGNPLEHHNFPRSSAYDHVWVMDNQMGPNVLWLTEWLTGEMELKKEMRVLDLGCGTAMSSIFLAREFGARVWAADLWIHPDDNWERIRAAGVDDRVIPIQTEAHALPFAREFFDAVVSVDAYHYFGTDELYLSYLSRFVRPHGAIGIAVPGLTREFTDGVPEHLTRKQSHGAPFWEDDCNSFKTLAWWQALWERSNRVEVVVADTLPDGWMHWRDFERALDDAGKNKFPSAAEALDADGGRYLGFVRLVGIRKEGERPLNLYDPSLIQRMKGDS
jgi:SAM-dependent methyltransferase